LRQAIAPCIAHRAASRGLYPQLTPSAIAKIALFSWAHMAKQSAMGSPNQRRIVSIDE
jgi:hypothetical protein